MPTQKKETEVEKAVKALEAAIRKARRAGMDIKATYTRPNDDGSTHTEKIGDV
jgi:hypothetical protein